METMVVNFESLYGGIYSGKRVVVTGHTGFKGSWLSLWLSMMGAKVYGFALEAPSQPNHLALVNPGINSTIGDIRDAEAVRKFMQAVQPEIVFHLAAQALVRDSYIDPIETYSSNVMGTLHVLEACRHTPSVRAIVNVTSDKCYDNKEWTWGYRENDPMGGFDPYSSSKGCAELLAASYRNSFFNLHDYKKKHNVLLGSVRAGNVIGGGDWAKDRLIPDIVRAASAGGEVSIRNPKATRPWQHVLEPLSGYLMLGWRLLEGRAEFAEGWNFGPSIDCNLTVDEIVQLARRNWDAVRVRYEVSMANAHEANLLMLDCSKANKLLHWRPVWTIEENLNKTIGWYKNYYTKGIINTASDISSFVASAEKTNQLWAQKHIMASVLQ